MSNLHKPNDVTKVTVITESEAEKQTHEYSGVWQFNNRISREGRGSSMFFEIGFFVPRGEAVQVTRELKGEQPAPTREFLPKNFGRKQRKALR